MLGCVPNVIDENKVIQKIESLDMTIFSKSGEKIYSITSPNSSYDNIELKLLIYKCCSYSSLFIIGVGLGRLVLLTNNPQLNCFFQGISSVYVSPS